MNNLWWCNIAHLNDLVEEDSTITISTTGVYYKNYYNHEDDDTITSLLFFGPQKFVWLPSNTISIFGADDKEKSGCVQDVSISATVHQYVLTVVS